MNQPVMKAAALSRPKIEFMTQQVLKDFCPQALSEMITLDIERMFEIYIPKRFGIATCYEELTPGIHGYTDPNRMTSAVSVNLIETNDPATLRFGRSTTGHEIGHVVLHARQFRKRKAELRFLHDEKHSGSVLFRQEDLKPYENPEWQAWEFCKSLFLPANVIKEAVEQGLTSWEIANKVNLNPAFVEVRLKNLKLN